MSAFSGRSQCFSCNYTLEWPELIPIASFFILKGRCKACRSMISIQYPLVEILTAVLFSASYFYFPLFHILPLLLLAWSALVVILIYDIKHKIIPNLYVYIFALAGFASIFFDNGKIVFIAPAIFDLFSGLIVASPFLALWLVSKGRWIGLGDAKLALGIGWFLGIWLGFSAVIISFWAGAVYAAFIYAYFKIRKIYRARYPLSLMDETITMKSEVPFAPFMIFGFGLVLFFEINLFQTLSQFHLF